MYFTLILICPVSFDPIGFASEQSRTSSSVYPYGKGRAHRSKPSCSYSTNFQTLQRFDGYAIATAPSVLDLTIFSVQLLHKLSIRGVNGPEKLLKVIKV